MIADGASWACRFCLDFLHFLVSPLRYPLSPKVFKGFKLGPDLTIEGLDRSEPYGCCTCLLKEVGCQAMLRPLLAVVCTAAVSNESSSASPDSGAQGEERVVLMDRQR